MPHHITGARRVGRLRGVVAFIALGVLAALVIGCNTDADGDDGQEAEAYIVVIEWVLADSDHAPAPEADEQALIFVESIGPDDIDLDVQISIVGHFEDEVDIRFIDDRTEAVDDELDDAPVRDRGVLLGLGAVDEDGPEMDVRGEIYRTTASVVGYRFHIDRSGQRPVMSKPPEQVDPEGLVTGP